MMAESSDALLIPYLDLLVLLIFSYYWSLGASLIWTCAFGPWET